MNKQGIINIIGMVLVIIAIAIGCKKQERTAKPLQKPIIDLEDTPRGISIQTINDCQYVYAETVHGVAIVHAANCNNPIHP